MEKKGISTQIMSVQAENILKPMSRSFTMRKESTKLLQLLQKAHYIEADNESGEMQIHAEEEEMASAK